MFTTQYVAAGLNTLAGWHHPSPNRSFYALSVPDLVVVVVGATRLQDIVWQHHLQAVSGNQPAATRSENDA